MFWNSDDLNEVAEVVTSVFGKQGNMEHTPSHPNIVIWNKSYGKLWYGDVSSLEELKEKCVLLAKKLSKDVCVSTLDSENIFTSPKYVFSQI